MECAAAQGIDLRRGRVQTFMHVRLTGLYSEYPRLLRVLYLHYVSRQSRKTMNIYSTEQILQQLIQLQNKPAPFTPGEVLFWDDPHISSQMLEAHLNPEIDAASRRPETIDRSIRWLIARLDLQPGDSILDLGCGPGLYASRFARAGLQVTGVDYSRRSIEYAVKHANENKLDIHYRYQNYL